MIKFLKNRYFKTVFLLVILVIVSRESANAVDDNPLEILFIGSSYFNYNDLPSLVENMANNSGKDVYIGSYNRVGLLLDQLVSLDLVEEKINERNWDYIIIQGVGVTIAYPDFYAQHQAYPALVEFEEKIHENCESTRMIFCLPWAFEDGMTWVEGWTDTYEDMQNIIYDKTIQYSDEIGFTIAPVGWAWYQVLDEKDYPLHYLHMSDWNHPSLKGSYLMACAIYSSIFIESTEEISYYAELAESDAKYFQNIASNIVLSDTTLWKISTYNDTTLASTDSTTNIPDYSNKNKTFLYQNYPNPFNSYTQIKYELQNDGFVKIEIFDLTGKKHFTFTEQQKAGIHSFSFDGSKLQSGIYLYNLKTNENCQLKKMQCIK